MTVAGPGVNSNGKLLIFVFSAFEKCIIREKARFTCRPQMFHAPYVRNLQAAHGKGVYADNCM